MKIAVLAKVVPFELSKCHPACSLLLIGSAASWIDPLCDPDSHQWCFLWKREKSVFKVRRSMAAFKLSISDISYPVGHDVRIYFAELSYEIVNFITSTRVSGKNKVIAVWTTKIPCRQGGWLRPPLGGWWNGTTMARYRYRYHKFLTPGLGNDDGGTQLDQQW